MAIIVAVERAGLRAMLRIERLKADARPADWPRRAITGRMHTREWPDRGTIPFYRKDDGGDLVETSFLCMGLLCARQLFRP